MNRRTFLSGTTAAATLAVAAPAGLAAPGAKQLKVLIPSMPPEQIADLKAAAPSALLVVCQTQAEALAQAADADASFGFITRELIRAGKKLRWVQQQSAGVEHVVNIPELVESEIILTNMQRAYAPEIADQAIGYLLGFTRSLVHFVRTQSQEDWARRPQVMLEELEGKTMLIIGLGGIGSEIARRAWGFGMKMLATDPKVLQKPEYVEELHKPAAFHSLLPRADVVASAVPLTPQSRKMIGEREFSMMKPGVILINVSRGGVVDTEALLRALESKQVAAAGLDVTDPEPLPKGHALWKQQNVIITPHSAGQSPGGSKRLFEVFRENLRRFAADEMLLNIVDKRAGY
ncbi:MAG TPA: D-2-hydroxyacid dehydrogenase [Isosphaeraceae bacterium]|nr:D-2-hydroxyacid dehydrogenase [Isosphaeraceae bacterium]